MPRRRQSGDGIAAQKATVNPDFRTGLEYADNVVIVLVCRRVQAVGVSVLGHRTNLARRATNSSRHELQLPARRHRAGVRLGDARGSGSGWPAPIGSPDGRRSPS